MLELKVRSRTAPPAPAPAPPAIPGERNANAYNVTRRMSGRSIVLGRVVPEGAVRRAFLKIGKVWTDLGAFDEGHMAITAVITKYNAALR